MNHNHLTVRQQISFRNPYPSILYPTLSWPIHRYSIPLLGILVLLSGIIACSSGRGESSSDPSKPAYFCEYSQHFEQGIIKVNEMILPIEIARNSRNMPLGLMYRKSIPDTFGMLFIYPYEQTLSFWMKNTSIPLDVGFFDQNQVLIEVKSMQPFDETSVVSSKSVKYALEVNRGGFTLMKCSVGCQFEWLKKPF